MYSLTINIVNFFLKIIALWNRKIRLFVNGRKNLLDRIAEAVSGHEGIIWFHTASMGEFEEARPIIEACREKYPDRKILLTFFSPSGYEPRKDWNVVDWVFYLPLDTARNARRFVEIVRPAKAIFTIGEYWYNLLGELRKHKVDTYIMSVLATKDALYTKWYGGKNRDLMRWVYKKIMVKTQETKDILESFGCSNVVLAGDARFDRVIAISKDRWKNDIVETWAAGKQAVVGGSTCDKDDDLVLAVAAAYPEEKVLMVPHELDRQPIEHILHSAKYGAVLYSDVEKDFCSEDPAVRERVADQLRDAQILVVDKIGMLSRLYRYGKCALIGGGFINMPHSVIEASVYGLPVVMGPQYHKNMQFVELMKLGAAVPVEKEEDILTWFGKFHDDPEYLAKVSKIAYDYCMASSGATRKIIDIIFG